MFVHVWLKGHRNIIALGTAISLIDYTMVISSSLRSFLKDIAFVKVFTTENRESFKKRGLCDIAESVDSVTKAELTDTYRLTVRFVDFFVRQIC